MKMQEMKKMTFGLAMGLAGAMAFGLGTPLASAEEAAPAAAVQQAPQYIDVDLPYTYTSQAFGYTIQCPKKPNVISADALFEGKKGEILIFDNEEYNIKNAWVIMKDAFDDKKMPDLNKISQDEAVKLLEGIMGSNGYEGIMLTNINDHNKGIFAMTAKEIEVDEDGDGKVDFTAQADNQMALTFFRGDDGNRYVVQLLDNPTLRMEALAAYQKGLTTFQTAK